MTKDVLILLIYKQALKSITINKHPVGTMTESDSAHKDAKNFQHFK